MPYVVEVATKEDIPALVQTTYEAFTNPFYKIFYVFFPHSCQSGTENELKEYNEAGGEIVWNKVYDSDDPEKAIVGGAKWYFYQRSPHEPRPGQEQTFIHPKDREADWYSKGSVAREFSNQVLQQHNAPRIQWTEGQPHCCMFHLHYCKVAQLTPAHCLIFSHRPASGFHRIRTSSQGSCEQISSMGR